MTTIPADLAFGFLVKSSKGKRKVVLTVIVGKLQIIIMRREEVFEGLLSTGVGSQLRDTVLLTAEDLNIMI